MKPYYQRDGITIYHADCREVLPDLDAELCLCDPPYGIGYVHGGNDCDKNPTAFAGIPVIGDDAPFDPSHLLHFPKLILWGGNNYASRLPDSKGWLVWDKRCGTVVNDHSDCELAWTNVIGTARLYYHVWDGFRRGTEKDLVRVHPTQKPVALMQWCIEKAKPTGRLVDPYMGSGTALVAAKLRGLEAVGIEIHEPYCEIAAGRLSQGVLNFQDERSEVSGQGPKRSSPEEETAEKNEAILNQGKG